MNKKNISNIITVTGLIIVNYSLIMYNLTKDYKYLVFTVIGLLCDYLDGYMARKLHIESKLGNLLDKVVDKINQTLIILTMINIYKISPIYLLLYFMREIMMFILRYYKYKSTKSSFYGKLKTFIFPLSLILYHINSYYKKIFINLLTIFNFITLFF